MTVRRPLDIFTPYIYDRVREYGNMISLTGRLRPGVTLAQAQAEADLLFPTLDGSVKKGYKGGYTARLWDLTDFISGSLRRSHRRRPSCLGWHGAFARNRVHAGLLLLRLAAQSEAL
jgi:hypothetical protein